MTINPPCLLALRALWQEYVKLPANELGIAGDTAHVGEGDSYHLGLPEQNPHGTYSVLSSPRDKAGLDEHAAAVDLGYWSLRVGGKQHDLRSYSVWLVAQCKAGTPDTRDIREVIYSPDGQVVRRWDRLGHSTTGDSSHLGHTHRSYFRDAIRAGRDQTAVDRRYLTEIGLIPAPVPAPPAVAGCRPVVYRYL